jgi:hypothetical protein
LKRRSIIQSLGLASTHVLFPSILAGFVSSCQNTSNTDTIFVPTFFNPKELKLIGEVIDIILPATNSKSASEVKVQHFLDEVFEKCMPTAEQNLIKEGLSTLSIEFSSTSDKNELIKIIDQQAYSGDHQFKYFRLIKQYTLIGFFTSQEGMTVASNFANFPGEFQGDIKIDEDALSLGKTDLRYYL